MNEEIKRIIETNTGAYERNLELIKKFGVEKLQQSFNLGIETYRSLEIIEDSVKVRQKELNDIKKFIGDKKDELSSVLAGVMAKSVFPKYENEIGEMGESKRASLIIEDESLLEE